MPIRINLLAEQQAAEEMRRRDPVKRAIWVAGALVALILLWSLNIQFTMLRKRSELKSRQSHWEQIEPEYVQASNDYRAVLSLTRKLESLQKYATNRFLWSRPLNALQTVSAPSIRAVNLEGGQTYARQKLVSTNKTVVLNLPPRSWWQWWSEPPEANIDDLVAQELKAITNHSHFLPFQSALKAQVNVVTNRIQIVAKLNVSKPETVRERTSLVIRARDYSNPAGGQMDKFYQTLTNSSYFKQFLGRANSSIQPESIQPRLDENDRISPARPFLPFTIESRYPDMIRSNE